MDSSDSFQQAARILNELHEQLVRYQSFLDQIEQLRNSSIALDGNIEQINAVYQNFSAKQKEITERLSAESERFEATLVNLRRLNAELENIIAADHVDLSARLETIRKDSFNRLLKDLRNDFDEHMKPLLKSTYADFTKECAKFKNDTIDIVKAYGNMFEKQVQLIVDTYNQYIQSINDLAKKYSKSQRKFLIFFLGAQVLLIVVIIASLFFFNVEIDFIRK